MDTEAPKSTHEPFMPPSMPDFPQQFSQQMVRLGLMAAPFFIGCALAIAFISTWFLAVLVLGMVVEGVIIFRFLRAQMEQSERYRSKLKAFGAETLEDWAQDTSIRPAQRFQAQMALMELRGERAHYRDVMMKINQQKPQKNDAGVQGKKRGGAVEKGD